MSVFLLGKVLRARKCFGALGSEFSLALHLCHSRAQTYTAIADLFHHLKPELSSSQLTKIVHMYSRLLHYPALGNNLHTLFAKVLIGLSDAIVNKETPQNAAFLITLTFNTCLDRLDALTVIHEEIAAAAERTKNGETSILNDAYIEKARPVGGAVYALEKAEEIMMGMFECSSCRATLIVHFRIPSSVSHIVARLSSMPRDVKKV